MRNEWARRPYGPEEELAVEVGDVDGVHVNDAQLLEAGEGEILEELAAEPAGAHHQHLHDATQLVPELCARIKR